MLKQHTNLEEAFNALDALFLAGYEINLGKSQDGDLFGGKGNIGKWVCSLDNLKEIPNDDEEEDEFGQKPILMEGASAQGSNYSLLTAINTALIEIDKAPVEIEVC
jgi:hypothetical protein